MHTLSMLQPRAPSGSPSTPQHPKDLVVMQEQWAFDGADENDFVIFRYHFANRGSQPIVGLRVGFTADFDLYRARTNVGRFDAETGVASVVSADSITEPVTGGMIVLGAPIANYYESLSTGPALSDAAHFELLTPSALSSSQSVVHDVRQIIAVEPLTLNPGETKSVGYAIIAGETSVEFMRNVALARQKASSLWH